MSAGRFLAVVFLAFFLVNLLFASLYFVLGVENIQGAVPSRGMENFLTCFLFSCQTFTTVGYGALSPGSPAVGLVSSFEALGGLLTFALASGLLYGRFSRPKSRLLYSNNVLLSPFRDGKALMFRIANRRTNVLMDLEARVILMLNDDPLAPHRRSYYQLELEVSKVHFLPLTWTIVHPITEQSSLWGLTVDELRHKSAELLILITGFDDTFNQVVHSRHSYTFNELVENATFELPYAVNDAGMITMDLQNIHSYKHTES
jgi:inward rectifier potassium channel